MSFVIRHGNAEDVPGIFRLIKELAEFEWAPEAVINTEANLLEAGFGKHPIYKVFVAEALDDNEIVGMALYYLTYSTWKGRIYYLDDLVVTERYRRYGVGQKLIDALLREAKEEGVNQVRWHVLDWNSPAIEFYKKIGVEFNEEWITCKMTKEQVNEYVSKL